MSCATVVSKRDGRVTDHNITCVYVMVFVSGGRVKIRENSPAGFDMNHLALQVHQHLPEALA